MLSKIFRKTLLSFILCSLVTFANIYTISIANITENNSQNNTNYKQEERRKHHRFDCKSIKYPINIKTTDKRISDVIDLSRGGISFFINNTTIETGEIIPVEIQYKDVEIKTTMRVLSSDDKRARGVFIPQDKDTLNGLLFLSIALEFDNGLLKTKLSEG